MLSTKIRNKARMSILAVSIQHNTGCLANVIRQEEIKDTQVVKKEVKFPLSVYMILCVRNSKESTYKKTV